MIDALVVLIVSLFGALMMAVASLAILGYGIARAAWLLFCWPSQLLSRLRR